ncbi:MAG TPA: hypothetical protein VM345_17320 [Acidimicrobiales bacterium]|nr:hypothetical protein [Acidimicrobiales bacterium]
MFRPLTAAAIAVALAFGGAACGRGIGDQSSARRRLEACDLVTREQAAEALGSPVRRPESTDAAGTDALAGRSGCAWATTDDRSAALIELVRTDDMADSVRRTGFSASARFQSARSRHAGAVEVDLGDRAFWDDDESTLYVLATRSYLTIEIATDKRSQARTLALRLGKIAVSELGGPDGQTDDRDV